jgi:hypothetical protein
MTKAETDVLSSIVQIIQNLTVKVDALEGALIRRGAILAGDRPNLEPEYLQAALTDLSAVRSSLYLLRKD